MSRLNVSVKKDPVFTHEGARTTHINQEQQLRRSVMACLLWEDQFYEDGQSIAERISKTIPKVSAGKVVEIAIEAREKMKLRHMPLFIVKEMAKLDSHKHLVADTLERVIQRADELAEFLAIYWKEGKCPLSSQVKKGLAKAFNKFNSYSLAKYNRDGEIKLRDVLFLSHAKPKDKEQELIWRQLIDNKLSIPDTWEVNLSTGKNKKETWERLLQENKLGGLALLRNLRNMSAVNVDTKLIISALDNMKVDRILPFRFITAANYAPNLEEYLEKAMLKCLSTQEKLKGKTIILLDVSGSMDSSVSSKSELKRIDAACGIGILLREICEEVEIFTFSDNLVQCPSRHGFALKDAIVNSQHHNGTYLGDAIRKCYDKSFERIIVLTDEQSHDYVPELLNKKAYMINISSCQNGVGYGSWLHIDGWSEAVIDYISNYEINSSLK